ncbi:hypothetical protein F8M41_021682 [Gigaspora margarita]|uniref:Uncharacterized protein n=1 Tax=Gigaspora margarita TaxID=4874 RepID=A0A8H4AGC9_GIGMA|nr:hypothetical protein F8M41_021682 [Gigaspora margarita]
MYDNNMTDKKTEDLLNGLTAALHDKANSHEESFDTKLKPQRTAETKTQNSRNYSIDNAEYATVYGPISRNPAATEHTSHGNIQSEIGEAVSYNDTQSIPREDNVMTGQPHTNQQKKKDVEIEQKKFDEI